jgi:hypothetical protein
VRRLLVGNVKDVQDSACGGLGGGRLSRVVGYMIAINDVVIPVSLSRLEGSTLESERAFPGSRLGRGLVLGKRKLAGVIVPRTEKMYGLDARGCAQRERKLNSCHCCGLLGMHLSVGFADCSSKKNWFGVVFGVLEERNYEVGQQLRILECNGCDIMSTAQVRRKQKSTRNDNG